MREITVKEAYESGITKGLYASPKGSKIISIKPTSKDGVYVVRSNAFPTTAGYKLRETFVLYLDEDRQAASVAKPKVKPVGSRGLARTIQLTQKGWNATEAMRREDRRGK